MDWPPVIERSSRTRGNRSRSARTSGGRKPELCVKYKLAIFDFDGTLADTVPWLVGVIDQVADRYGFNRLDGQDLERLRDYDSRRLLKHLGVPLWKLPMIGNHMRNLMARDIETIPLFDGVETLLRELSAKGVALAIVSSNSYDNIRTVLGPEIGSLISFYECGTSLFGKHARIRRVLRASGCPATHAIYIGDEIRDLEASRRERIAFGAVSWGYARVEALKAHSPAEVFASIEEILEKVAAHPRTS
jgi:phosphoglycolate phosphatase